MQVDKLWLTDFRNYEQAEAEFAQGLNVVTGRNGQGKTNLLEAIAILATQGSHRSSTNLPLVRKGADRAIVRAAGYSGGRAVSIDAELKTTGGVRLLVNKVSPERASDAARILTSVLFSPEDLTLTKGGPDERRRFLDHAAARLRPLAAQSRVEFERTLRQRGGVLKAASTSRRAAGHLEVWDEQLIKASIVLIRHRMELLRAIQPQASFRYAEVAGDAPSLTLSYEASWAGQQEEEPEGLADEQIESMLRASFERNMAKDLERGITHTGPHRDDVAIVLKGSDARLYASQGEQRSIALSLRLAERDLIAKSRGEDPILLLDDVFSELDERRQLQLAELVMAAGQTIATTTSAGSLPLPKGRTIYIEEGKVLEGG